MKDYSMIRIGNEYVVQAGEKSVLKIGSRRRAVGLVTDAAELLEREPAASTDGAASNARDIKAISDSAKVP
jgi:hypothetical protein